MTGFELEEVEAPAEVVAAAAAPAAEVVTVAAAPVAEAITLKTSGAQATASTPIVTNLVATADGKVTYTEGSDEDYIIIYKFFDDNGIFAHGTVIKGEFMPIVDVGLVVGAFEVQMTAVLTATGEVLPTVGTTDPITPELPEIEKTVTATLSIWDGAWAEQTTFEGIADNGLFVQVNYNNETNANVDAKVIVAFYNGDVFMSSKTVPCTLGTTNDGEIFLPENGEGDPVPFESGATKVKVFLWNALTQEPIAAAVEFAAN